MWHNMESAVVVYQRTMHEWAVVGLAKDWEAADKMVARMERTDRLLGESWDYASAMFPIEEK